MNPSVVQTRPTLAAMGRGFVQPVDAAQQVFRAVLEATSRPGRLQTLRAQALEGLEPPGIHHGLAALLLSLLDAETSLWLHPAFATAAVADYLSFHSGVRMQAEPQDAAFAVLDAAQARPDLWARLNAGSDETPQAGATLVIDVPSLADTASGPGPALCLRGPGIAEHHRLAVGGLDAPFWQARAEREALFPRGVDLILVCGDTLAAVPRSTRVTLED